MLRKKLATAVAAALVLVTLAGCANPIVVASAQKALQPLAENPMPGFKLSLKYDPSCGIDYCTVNPRYEFTSNNPTKTRPEFCKDLLTWATKYGADSWLFDPENIAIPTKGHEASFQVACASGESALLGTSENGVRWLLSGNSSMYQFGTVLNTDGQLDDARTKLVGWNDAIGQLSSGAQRNLEILDAVNSYRIGHPQENPRALETVKNALKAVKQSSDIKLIEDSKGKVNHLQVPADGFLVERCINIEPFDETYFLVPDPGTGIFGSYRNEEDTPLEEFGFITSGVCPQ
jgi:hypothetical protein